MVPQYPRPATLISHVCFEGADQWLRTLDENGAGVELTATNNGNVEEVGTYVVEMGGCGWLGIASEPEAVGGEGNDTNVRY